MKVSTMNQQGKTGSWSKRGKKKLWGEALAMWAEFRWGTT